MIDAAEPALFRAANGKPLAEQPINRVVFGRWGADVLEEVVVCRTDQTSVEIHCHGGDAAVERILRDLESLGCRIETWQEQQARTQGELETECAEALGQAGTLRTAQILLEQHSGTLRAALEKLAAVEWTDAGREQLVRMLDDLLRWGEFGRHLTDPWQVVLAGRPNVGKSSLINALVGYARAIVHERPGTTRDVVTAETAFAGWPVRFADTAGIRTEAETLEAAGIERARRQLAEADCRIILFDISQLPSEDDRRLIAAWPGAILVAHKCDLPDAWGSDVPDGALRVSSVTGAGIEELAKQLVERLVPEVPPSGTAIPIRARQTDLLHSARKAAMHDDRSIFAEACRELLR